LLEACDADQERTRRAPVSITSYNLLALSDVHLGSELVQHVRPGLPPCSATSLRRDRDLAALLDWYAERRVEGRPWKLIIAGDFIDFTGMCVSPADEITTAPTSEELEHGLGGAADHALAKLRLVMRQHELVMQALARFLRAGHRLVVVPGNHDADWHWASMQAEFQHVLSSAGGVAPDQIEFSPWFYCEEGVIYLEHGHQYDSFCSHDHVLYPVSPNDPRRTTFSLSDILVRYVVRPTPGMTEGGHDSMQALDYVRFALSLGAGGMLALVGRFLRVLGAALSLWREHWSHATASVRREHERMLERWCEVRQTRVERALELVRLQLPPLTRSLAGIATSLMLDWVLLGVSIAAAVAAVVIWLDHWQAASLAGCALVASVVILRRTWLVRPGVEPSSSLRERAGRLAQLFPSAVVVMGHTHLPEIHKTAAQSLYINLGAWAEEETPDGRAPALPATRTHLVLTRNSLGPSAQLLTWGDGAPRPFEPRAAS
jgi:UDP-2,3-diacylglucosamine pyrophosphatase LpxH